jgi:hypothetical protein
MIEPVFLVHHNLAREAEVAAATQAVHETGAEQMAIGHHRGFDRLLIGIKDPKVLRGPPVENQLIARGRSDLAEADDAHATGKELVGFFREGSVLFEFNHVLFSI